MNEIPCVGSHTGEVVLCWAWLSRLNMNTCQMNIKTIILLMFLGLILGEGTRHHNRSHRTEQREESQANKQAPQIRIYRITKLQKLS